MNPKKAIKELERQLRKEPDNLVLRLKLAANYREVGRTEEAVALYRSVAVAYHAQGRLAQAIAVCRSVLEIEPSQPETQRLLAELDQMRNATAAQAEAEQVATAGNEIPSLAAPPPAKPPPKARTPAPARRSSPQLAQERPSPTGGEFGPGSGMTPSHDDDVVAPVDSLPAQMAALRQQRQRPATPQPAPRTTERMREPPKRFTGPLLTPTPLPEPLALHDSEDESSERRPPRRTLHGRPASGRTPTPPPIPGAAARRTLRGPLPDHRTPPPAPAPLPPPDDDDDAMTRIADDRFESILAGESGRTVPAPDSEVDFDGVTAPLPDRPRPDDVHDDGPTRIAPDLPFASDAADPDEMATMIADESGLLPKMTAEPALPEPAPPAEPRLASSPVIAPGEPPSRRGAMAHRSADFTRQTRPIETALDSGGDFDEMPTGANLLDEEPPTDTLPPQPSEAGGTLPQVDAGRATADLDPAAFDSFRADIAGGDEFAEVTEDRVEHEQTNPGQVDGDSAQTAVTAPPRPRRDRDSVDNLRLDRAFKRPFSATIDKLAPDGAVIDVPLSIFSSLPQPALEEMGRRMILQTYRPGEIVVEEGEPGNACYVIAHGEVRILKRNPLRPAGDRIEVARLGSGSMFGEFALLADRRRHATVQAVDESEIYEIPRRLLRELAVNYPGVGPALEEFYRERLLATLLQTAPFFKPLPEDRRGELLALFKPLRAESGSRIVREGEPAGGLYLIVLGSVEITKRVGERRSVLLATLGEGAYFGEMSLLRGDVASASVTAVGPTELAVMSPKDFYQVVSENPLLWDEVRREANRRQLENNQIVTGETNAV
jgi:CRP-like cAMP-binding protein